MIASSRGAPVPCVAPGELVYLVCLVCPDEPPTKRTAFLTHPALTRRRSGGVQLSIWHVEEEGP